MRPCSAAPTGLRSGASRVEPKPLRWLCAASRLRRSGWSKPRRHQSCRWPCLARRWPRRRHTVRTRFSSYEIWLDPANSYLPARAIRHNGAGEVDFDLLLERVEPGP
jgi:hypothetical protein